MAAYTWPASLPQFVRKDFSGSGGVRVLRTPMDKGAPKQRFIGKRAKPMNVSMVMTKPQLATFEAFVNDTIKGVAPFEFPHPVTGVNADMRIIPSEDKLYDYAFYSSGNWLVSFGVEVLP